MTSRPPSESCTVTRALEVVGDRWTVLVLRDAFYGVRRFDEFVADLGIARNVLSDRLSRLVDNGAMERRLYEHKPARYEYRLTDKGKDLLPVLLSLMRWGDRWESDGQPPVHLCHEPCGNVLSPTLVCDACREEIAWRDLRLGTPSPLRVPPDRVAAGG